MYRAITENIEVTVEPFYLEEQSSPDESPLCLGVSGNDCQSLDYSSAVTLENMENYRCAWAH